MACCCALRLNRAEVERYGLPEQAAGDWPWVEVFLDATGMQGVDGKVPRLRLWRALRGNDTFSFASARDYTYLCKIAVENLQRQIG